MRKYFEYEFNDEIRDKLLDYYNSSKGIGDFDDGYKKTVHKLERIKSYVSYNQNDFICDVGCADATLIKYLSGKYKKAVGLDISEDIIIQDCSLNICNVEFKTFDGSHINTLEKYDKVFLLDVLEHAFDPDSLIDSIFESLKEGGQFIMQVPSTGWLSELVFGKYHYGHLRYYDEMYLKTYLEKHGFKVLHVETFNSVPWSQKIINYPRLFAVLNKLCSFIPHSIYPYYGSVAAISTR